MSHIYDVNNPEKSHDNKNLSNKNCISDRDKQKLNPREFKALSPADKTDYYKKRGMDNFADIRNGINNKNEGNGLSYKPEKLNSDNYEKISKNRNYSPNESKDKKESFAKWSPDSKDNNSLRNEPVTARHAKKGEEFKTTHPEDRKPSGEFVSKDSLGDTPKKRIKNGALYPGNTAEKESNVKLGKDQNLIEGKIGPQSKFEKSDGIKRPGGGYQTITDGGYRNKAIEDK